MPVPFLALVQASSPYPLLLKEERGFVEGAKALLSSLRRRGGARGRQAVGR